MTGMEQSARSRGGRAYIPICERQTVQTQLRSKTAMWLLGPVLDRLNSNQKLPIKGDILRYVEGRKLRGLKGVRLETHICCPLIDGTECQHLTFLTN